MERLAVARMATAKLQGWIHAARGMDASGSVSTELKSYQPGLIHPHIADTFRAPGRGNDMTALAFNPQ